MKNTNRTWENYLEFLKEQGWTPRYTNVIDNIYEETCSEYWVTKNDDNYEFTPGEEILRTSLKLNYSKAKTKKNLFDLVTRDLLHHSGDNDIYSEVCCDAVFYVIGKAEKLDLASIQEDNDGAMFENVDGKKRYLSWKEVSKVCVAKKYAELETRKVQFSKILPTLRKEVPTEVVCHSRELKPFKDYIQKEVTEFGRAQKNKNKAKDLSI